MRPPTPLTPAWRALYANDPFAASAIAQDDPLQAVLKWHGASITLGAIASHLRIGSPATALPAIVYTAIQVWFGLERRRAKAGAER